MGKTMKNMSLSIFKISAPFIFAMLGSLFTEYTGALAIFMEGAIELSAFISTIFIVSTGYKILGFIGSSLIIMLVIFFTSLFINRYKANPFLVALSVNMFSEGVCSFYVSNFSNTHTIAFSAFPLSKHITSDSSMIASVVAVFFTILTFIFLKYTSYGVRLRYIGKYDKVLHLKGVNPTSYKIFSWTLAAFFASCAGNTLLFRLAAYSYGMSLGKGWIGILAVFLGLKKPLLCLVAVFIFSIAEYGAGILQNKIAISPTLMLSFPYIISFACYLIYKIYTNKKDSEMY